jgi:hypothetical protein
VTTVTLSERIDRLVDNWCGERHLDALRILLPVWPPVSPLTDEWARVHESLKVVYERAAVDFNTAERRELEEIVLAVGRAVYER